MTTLSHAFKGMDPEEHRIRRVLMVGATPENGSGLSLNDRALLRETVRILDEFKIPMTPDLEEAIDLLHDCSQDTVRIINILSEHGGEDFLHTREKGDVVILCNIKRDVDPAYKIDARTYNPQTPPSLRKAFLSSAEHDDHARWTGKILETGAKFAFIFGYDNFETSDLNKGQFVTINTPNIPKGVLINREHFELSENFFLEQKSPLAALTPLADDPQNVFFYDTFSFDRSAHKIRLAL